MSGIEVYPQAAADAGCTATATVVGSDSGDGWWQNWYQFSATADGGWTFDHFEWTQNDRYSNSATGSGYDRNYNYTSANNPAGGSGQSRYEEFNQVDGYETWTMTITTCRAVFNAPVAKKTKITVGTSAEPEEGGTTSPVSETKEGNVGSSTTFTLTATPEDGYRFVKWEGNGETIRQRTASVTLTFGDEDKTVEYVATFRPFGEILCNSSGVILHGSAGSPLYDDGDGDDTA